MEINEEGCLSVPEYYAKVKRSTNITVRFWDQYQKMSEIEADELLAICIQHEIDHLKGKLFVDYLSPLKKQMVRKKMLKLAKIAG